MTMQKNAPIFLQARPGDSLASGLIGIEGGGQADICGWFVSRNLT
jgi:hypothetical protein